MSDAEPDVVEPVTVPELTLADWVAAGDTSERDDPEISMDEADAKPDREGCNEDDEGVGIYHLVSDSTIAELELRKNSLVSPEIDSLTTVTAGVVADVVAVPDQGQPVRVTVLESPLLPKAKGALPVVT